MTYQEYYQRLRIDFAMKSEIFVNAEKDLTGEPNGFVNKMILEKYIKAKIEWENASKAYVTLLDFARQNNVNPNDNIVD